MAPTSTIFDDAIAHPHWHPASLDNALRITADEVHLWFVPLDINNKQEQQALNWLNELQKQKYLKRGSNALQQASYLAGRYYLFKFLSHYSNIPEEALTLCYSRLNKPYLHDHNNPEQQIKFNFTDTQIENKSVGLFAFSRHCELGVDMESTQRTANFSAIARRRFSSTELEYCLASDEAYFKERFLSIWTRKEAFGKAMALGINYQMRHRNLLEPRSPAFQFSNEQQDWSLHQIMLPDQLIGALVHSGHEKLELRTFRL